MVFQFLPMELYGPHPFTQFRLEVDNNIVLKGKIVENYKTDKTRNSMHIIYMFIELDKANTYVWL